MTDHLSLALTLAAMEKGSVVVCGPEDETFVVMPLTEAEENDFGWTVDGRQWNRRAENASNR